MEPTEFTLELLDAVLAIATAKHAGESAAAADRVRALIARVNAASEALTAEPSEQ